MFLVVYFCNLLAFYFGKVLESFCVLYFLYICGLMVVSVRLLQYDKFVVFASGLFIMLF